MSPYKQPYQQYRRPQSTHDHKTFMEKLEGFISKKTRALFFCEGRKEEPRKEPVKKRRKKHVKKQ